MDPKTAEDAALGVSASTGEVGLAGMGPGAPQEVLDVFADCASRV